MGGALEMDRLGSLLPSEKGYKFPEGHMSSPAICTAFGSIRLSSTQSKHIGVNDPGLALPIGTSIGRGREGGEGGEPPASLL